VEDHAAANAISAKTQFFNLAMKEIRWSDHAKLKLEVLAGHGFTIQSEFVVEVVRSPDHLESGGEDKLVAQRRLDQSRVLRVVYREFNAFILIITLYPGRRSRCEKN
jgi:hypothetical protein